MHAWLFKRFGAKLRKIPSALLELNWKRHGKQLHGEYLKDGAHLLKGIQQKITELQHTSTELAQKMANAPNRWKQRWHKAKRKRLLHKLDQLKAFKGLSKQDAEALRQKLVKAKMDLLIPDLITECLIFGNIGFITNAFSKWMSGNQQFTGEQGIVSTEALKALYKQRKEEQLGGLSQRTRQLITIGLSILLPLGVGKTLQHALKKTNPTGVWKKIKRIAYRFDYENGQWMSMPALMVVVALQEIGQLMASRSQREFSEGFLRESIANVLFFAGNDFFAIGLARGLGRLLKKPVSHRLSQLPVHASTTSKKASAAAYLGGFGINVLALASVILGNNALTTHHLKQDAREYYQDLAKQRINNQPLADRQHRLKKQRLFFSQ